MAKSKSLLTNFLAMPRRAIGDRRLGLRHLRVLGAICGAVNNETGYAKIRQARISETVGVPRAKISAIVKDLSDWGYVRASKLERKTGGHFKTLTYEVLYEEPYDHFCAQRQPCSLSGSKHHATSEDSTAVLPSEEQESDYPESWPAYPHHHQRMDDGGEGPLEFADFIADWFLEARRQLFPRGKSIRRSHAVTGARRLWEQTLMFMEERGYFLDELNWDHRDLAQFCAETIDRRIHNLARKDKGPPSSPEFCHLTIKDELVSLFHCLR